MISLLMLLNLIFVACDALRDKWLCNRDADVTWLQWHIVKWLEFFGMESIITLLAVKAGYIPLDSFSIFIGILYTILCSITWNVLYRWEE